MLAESCSTARPLLGSSARCCTAMRLDACRRVARRAGSGTAGSWRCRRPGASQSLRRWCSRRTWRVCGCGPDGRGRPRRARHAESDGRPAACHPTRPGAPPRRADGRVSPPRARSRRGQRGPAPACSSHPDGKVGEHDPARFVLAHRRRHTNPATGSPVTSTATTRLAPLVRPNGPPRSWNMAPPLDAPRARCVSTTTIDGVASARPSASRAAACSIVTARRSSPCLRPRLPGASNTGYNSAHCSSVRSLGYTMPRTVTTDGGAAIGTHPVRPGWSQASVASPSSLASRETPSARSSSPRAYDSRR